jgi:O-antigen ligase
MMLVIFLIFLRQNITVLQPQRILLILKIIIGILLFISLVRPAVQTIYDNLEVFRGAMGNANTMGQIGAIGTLLYFHSYLNERNRWILFQAGLTCGAAVIVWKSGSRVRWSLLSGIGLLTLFYQAKMRKICWTYSMNLYHGVIFRNYLVRQSDLSLEPGYSTVLSEQMTKSRKDVWRAAWDGFKQRPIFGWGFGADSGITKNWNFGLTALGMVERDPVNDFLFMLEGCGIIGFLAYFLLSYIGLKQMPTALETLTLKRQQCFIYASRSCHILVSW